MSNQQNSQNPNHRRRGIRGPRSALTDFLESNNISANQIRQDAEARREAAAEAAASNNEGNSAASDEAATGAVSIQQTLKRRRQAQEIAKIKSKKSFRRSKIDSGHADFDSDDYALAIWERKSAPLPGQMDNCEICGKRFTVTAYSTAGPKGGLCCFQCGKALAKDKAGPSKKKGNPGPKGDGRRKLQSKIMDGISPVGTKSLMHLCVETMTRNIHLANDLGCLPDQLIDRIARMLSKHRLLTSKTLDLFLRSDAEQIQVYDGGALTTDDYIRIFQKTSKLKTLKVKSAIMFKDDVMKYLISRQIMLENLYVHGANLLTEDCWMDYLVVKGKHLKALRIYWTDKHVGDNLVKSLHELCPSLRRLKISHNQMVTDKGVEAIAKLDGLEHLGLDLRTKTSTMAYIKVIDNIGETLQTFSLSKVPGIDDRLLDALHKNCRKMRKLRITESECMTDAGFVRLFTDWANKPLSFIDLEKCCHVDAQKPRENAHMNGLCSDGFKALMKHSGKKLRYLNVNSCRHISKEAFEEVFSEGKQYPELLKMELCFCQEVNDFIVGWIFRCCPKIREVIVFGCMKVAAVQVPRGKILVGVPTAHGMIIEGED